MSNNYDYVQGQETSVLTTRSPHERSELEKTDLNSYTVLHSCESRVQKGVTSVVCHDLCKNPTAVRKQKDTNLFTMFSEIQNLGVGLDLFNHVYLVAVKKWSTKGILFLWTSEDTINYYIVKETFLYELPTSHYKICCSIHVFI
ncbi:hypothetical protein L798_02337 [Zootermopsis nevadensis]|uniref:Uncharacterized protein n=1 Tax=Zootermopsis nevadensis TaxID=136037 RepID=A0A067QS03_ZOONE|nr:hypothetical protein L798_02337 [Zootermopsis nevadensis]